MPFEHALDRGGAYGGNYFYACTSDNVNSWTEETFQLPANGAPQSMRRRFLLYMSFHAVNVPATLQVAPAENIGTYFFIKRGARVITPKMMAILYHVGVATASGDLETLPTASWTNPLNFALLGGDVITVAIPGDADATPNQDWQLDILMGPEQSRFKR